MSLAGLICSLVVGCGPIEESDETLEIDDDETGSTAEALTAPADYRVSLSPNIINCVDSEDAGGDELLIVWTLERIKGGVIVDARMGAEQVFVESGQVVRASDPGVAFTPITMQAVAGEQVRYRFAFIDVDDDSDELEMLSQIMHASEIVNSGASLFLPVATPITGVIDTALHVAYGAWLFFDWLDENDELGSFTSSTYDVAQIAGGSGYNNVALSVGGDDYLYHNRANFSVQPLERAPVHVSLRSVSNLSTCVDIPNASVQSGTWLQSSGCNGSDKQRWFIQPTSNSSEVLVRSSSNGLCMALATGSTHATVSGIPIVQTTCTGDMSQRFSLIKDTTRTADLGNARALLKSSASALCVKVDNGKLVQRACATSDTNEAFELVVEEVVAGDYAVSGPGGTCVDIPNAATTPTTLQHHACHYGSNQRWRFETLGGGRVRVRSASSNLCVTASSSSNVSQAPCDGRASQRLAVRPRADGRFELYGDDARACIGRPWNPSQGAWLQKDSCGVYAETPWVFDRQ